jgi:hypothetical protein
VLIIARNFVKDAIVQNCTLLTIRTCVSHFSRNNFVESTCVGGLAGIIIFGTSTATQVGTPRYDRSVCSRGRSHLKSR